MIYPQKRSDDHLKRRSLSHQRHPSLSRHTTLTLPSLTLSLHPPCPPSLKSLHTYLPPSPASTILLSPHPLVPPSHTCKPVPSLAPSSLSKSPTLVPPSHRPDSTLPPCFSLSLSSPCPRVALFLSPATSLLSTNPPSLCPHRPISLPAFSTLLVGSSTASLPTNSRLHPPALPLVPRSLLSPHIVTFPDALQ